MSLEKNSHTDVRGVKGVRNVARFELFAKMLKMGVKKKHEHESNFFEENLLGEPAKTNRNLPSDWLQPYRNQTSHSIPTQQQINGDTNYLNKPMELLDISHGINTNNKNYSNYLAVYDRENMSSTTSESKSKHSSRNRTYRNQVASSSNDNTIVISDEEDDDEYPRSHRTHNQANDGIFTSIIFFGFVFLVFLYHCRIFFC